MQAHPLSKCLALTAAALCAVTVMARAADPVIHVQWDYGGTPVRGTDYTVGSGAFPYVQLKTVNHNDWRVWSTDTDNPGEIGDIGSVSLDPSGEGYFVVRLARPDGSAGARDVSSIVLNPTGNSWSNLQDSVLTEGVSGTPIAGP